MPDLKRLPESFFQIYKRLFRTRLKKIILYFLLSLFLILLWPQGRLFPTDYSTIIYDRHGKMLSVFLNEREQWHFPPQDSLIVPKKLKTCVMQYEDHWFNWHPGINPVALFRASWQNISAGKIVSGASTITMQIARLSDPKARTIWNKLVEMLKAVRIELRYSKNEILKLYLDHAPYGGNTVGYRAACWRYFGKEPQALTWAEGATLAVLPNAPGLISPQSNPSILKEKRNHLLGDLFREHIIDASTLNLAKMEPVPHGVFELPKQAPHLAFNIQHNKGNRGRQITTTIDFNLQQSAEDIVHQQSQYLQRYGITNAAAIIVNTQSGEVQAYVGSQDFWDVKYNGMVDGVLAPRSSGSLLKPFLYALSMDEAIILPSTRLRDIPTYYGAFSPANADERFHGAVKAKDALVRSLNVPAVRLLNTFGYASFYEYLKWMGLKHLFRTADDYGLPLILGGAEVSLWEMARLYRGLAMGGVFNSISALYKETDEEQSQYSDRQIISKGAAYLTLQMLKELKRPGSEYYWQQYQNQWPLAWKTGTSYGQRDGWAVGVNPQWTIAVWVGNFTGEGNPDLAGSKCAGPILFDLFNMLPKDKELSWFTRPEAELSDVKLCAWSGYFASENCPDVIVADAPRMMRPLQLCPWHNTIFVDDKEQFQVCSLCWQDGKYHTIKRLVLEPDLSQYLRQQGELIAEEPPHNPACPGEHGGSPVEIIYPAKNAHLWIPRDYDGTYQKVTVRGAHRFADKKIFWYLDAYYLGSTQDEHVMTLSLSDGWHSLVLVDENGHSARRKFYSGRNK